MGGISSQLKSLENDSIDNPALAPELLANSVTTFMVRGLFLNIEFPFAIFLAEKWQGICSMNHYGKV